MTMWLITVEALMHEMLCGPKHSTLCVEVNTVGSRSKRK